VVKNEIVMQEEPPLPKLPDRGFKRNPATPRKMPAVKQLETPEPRVEHVKPSVGVVNGPPKRMA
jgi:hypothetical protein